MESSVTIGLDLGKSVFQVHGVDAGGTVVVQRRLTRSKLLAFFAKQPACLVGMEACAAAHRWGRELSKLGHRVRLMPPRYVKPYVKRQKNDAADAEAICEAVIRPTMRFVEIKTCEQQGTLVLHRVRLMLMRQRVQLSNAIWGHMAEYGLVAPVGRNGLQRLITILNNRGDRMDVGRFAQGRHCRVCSDRCAPHNVRPDHIWARYGRIRHCIPSRSAGRLLGE